MLRLVTAGSVDDGKSTLVGRLLHDAGALPEDHLEALRRLAGRDGSPLDFSLVTDGLKAEREQGITIDVAYRYFDTPRRRFVIADTPGHEQYTRNMATGASTADLAVILVDASLGVLTQGRRHGFIASLLGVPRVVVAVNKMDLVEYAREPFERIREEYEVFAARLGFRDLAFIPTCAKHGDNVVARSARMPWYGGATLLSHLEAAYVGGDANLVDLRFPVQRVNRAPDGVRAYGGTIASGVLRAGDPVVVLPSGVRTCVERVLAFDGDLPHAYAPQSVAITLADDVDAGRGDLIAHPGNVPRSARSIEAMVVWMSNTPLAAGRAFIVKHATRSVKATCHGIAYRVDPDTLRHAAAGELGLNDIGRATFTLFQPLYVDDYKLNRAMGSLILIDPDSQATVGAAMVVSSRVAGARPAGTPASRDISPEIGLVAVAAREALLGQKPRTLWLTGLSGSGKSTLSKEVERILVDRGRACIVLDGDNLRHGLSSDLGFSPGDRRENIRRAAEVARLMNEAGLIVLCAFISPYRADREMARAIVGEERFFEVYLSADVATCERRNPKGLYSKARRGEIAGFTGIGAPYETPQDPALVLDTEGMDVVQCVRRLLELVGVPP
jgi:bifunctional enzyme CysN/CysC